MPAQLRFAVFAVLTAAVAMLLITAAGAAVPKRPRYAAKLADESRLEHDALTDWYGPLLAPKLGDRPIFDAQNPVVWLLDRQLTPAEPPAAFVETFTGDRLPGTVLGYRRSPPADVSRQFEYWLVRPQVALSPPRQVEDGAVRIAAHFVRRVVFQRRSIDRYQPGTVFCRDGRTIRFRSARFQDSEALLLVADGTRPVRYDEISELHLPANEFWDRYFSELAVLTPEADARLLQIETADGLVVTTSLQQFTAAARGGNKAAEHWLHGLQPAWSPDVLWVPHRRIWLRRLFAPHEVPLSRVPALGNDERPILNQAAWPPVTNRNTRGGVLRCGTRDFGWGIGVHAFSQLHFPLPPLATAFRTEVGLDRVVGGGGCVQTRVFLDDAQSKPLFESPVIVGSNDTVKTGRLVFPPGTTKPKELLLQVDPAHANRPPGADPLDIRDTTDWLDPVLELDPALVKAEVRRRAPLQVAAWQGWSMEPHDAVTWPATLREPSQHPGMFVRPVVALKKPLTLTRTVSADASADWLILSVAQSRLASGGPRVQVRVNGEQVFDQEVPFRNSPDQPARPLVVPLSDYRSRGVKEWRLEIRQVPPEAEVPVDWLGLTLHRQLPMLATLFEDTGKFVAVEGSQASAKVVHDEFYTGQAAVKIGVGGRFRLALPQRLEIRAQPQWGQFRFLRFAVSKKGAGRLGCEVDHADAEHRPARYDAGRGEPVWPKARRAWDQPLPAQWVVVTRDLYEDFGSLDVTGLTWVVPDGQEALVDHVYLARNRDDFDYLPSAPPAELTNQQALQALVGPVLAQTLPACVALDFRDGRFGTGAIIAADGHVLTAGHLVLAPDRDVTVHLADGRALAGKTRGVYRNLDLGLVKISDPGQYPAMEIDPNPQLTASELYIPLTHRRTFQKDQKPASTVTRLQRILPAESWTQYEAPDWSAGGPLVHRWGKLVGVQTHRSGFGGFVYATFGQDRSYLERMKTGAVWGAWKLGTGPLIGVVLRTTTQGCRVMEILPNTAAAKLDFRAGDLVRKIRGQAVKTLDDAYQALAETNPGDTVDVEYEREGKPLTARLTLAPRVP